MTNTPDIDRFPNDLTNQVTRDGHDPVASGGFADIYRGIFQDNGRSIKVAIKAIKTYSSEDGNFAKKHKRLRREIKVWLNLRHDNVLPLFGTTMDFGRFPAMVCPWVENGTLSSYLDNRYHNLCEIEVLDLLNDVASGLQYLHSRSVVHGDLSGSNVLVHGNGRACIADFGLSLLLTEIGTSTFATSFHARGTLRWTAPELLDLEVPEHDVDEDLPRVTATVQSDVYSFGSIMLQILSGKVPYHYYKREAQVLHAISKGNMPRRPTSTLITEHRWMFIKLCWSAVGTRRPSSERIVEFTVEELAEHLSGIVMPTPAEDVDVTMSEAKSRLPIIEHWDEPLVAQSLAPAALESTRLGQVLTINRPMKVKPRGIARTQDQNFHCPMKVKPRGTTRMRDRNSTRPSRVVPRYRPDSEKYVHQSMGSRSGIRASPLSVSLPSPSMSAMETIQQEGESLVLMGVSPCKYARTPLSRLYVASAGDHEMNHSPLSSGGSRQQDGGSGNHHTVHMSASGSQPGSPPYTGNIQSATPLISSFPTPGPPFSGLDDIRSYNPNKYSTSDQIPLWQTFNTTDLQFPFTLSEDSSPDLHDRWQSPAQAHL